MTDSPTSSIDASAAGVASEATDVIGRAVRRGDALYEARRRALSWNERIPEDFPDLIVSAANLEDVRDAVRHAGMHDIPVAIRSGGHSYVASSVRDRALVIDVSALDTITIDESRATAVVGPGVTGRDLAARLAERGFAFPIGHCGGVAMGGYLLGGGLGFNFNVWGQACFSVTGLDVVLADGAHRTVDDVSDPDLMWLARGVGAGFPGVITGYHLQLQNLPHGVAVSTYVYPAHLRSEITGWLTELSANLRPTVELTTTLAGRCVAEVIGFDAPPEDNFVVVTAVAFEQSEADADAALDPLRRGPHVNQALISNHAAPFRFQDLPQLFDAFMPDGFRMKGDSFWLDLSTHEALGIVADHATRGPSPKSQILAVTPSLRTVPRDAAFSMWRKTFVLVYSLWQSADADQENLQWVKETADLLSEVTEGYWLGETDLTAAPTRLSRSFSASSWTRIQALRKKFDPESRFVGWVTAGTET
ncbi:FAD-binding oxidoreductase [Mycobacterium sp. 852013-50091_SCH5140682]|uniref:FAD-binding oxidoreductase n=1 Tax=Mycobacterium sp. 852013-50091_SCH5140682 TaxID=1834109 RepID=UPI000AEE96C4|nr:FAD-binding oxidoreductase [Mycobacterium sp. 852013-50091_SCH5140682]